MSTLVTNGAAYIYPPELVIADSDHPSLVQVWPADVHLPTQIFLGDGVDVGDGVGPSDVQHHVVAPTVGLEHLHAFLAQLSLQTRRTFFISLQQ